VEFIDAVIQVTASCFCRYFVIANAIASLYNLVVVLAVRRLVQGRVQRLVLLVHMTDMVTSVSLSRSSVKLNAT
jgi:hypothetical protein